MPNLYENHICRWGHINPRIDILLFSLTDYIWKAKKRKIIVRSSLSWSDAQRKSKKVFKRRSKRCYILRPKKEDMTSNLILK